MTELSFFYFKKIICFSRPLLSNSFLIPVQDPWACFNEHKLSRVRSFLTPHKRPQGRPASWFLLACQQLLRHCAAVGRFKSHPGRLSAFGYDSKVLMHAEMVQAVWIVWSKTKDQRGDVAMPTIAPDQHATVSSCSVVSTRRFENCRN